jgi:hypothetical protein
VFGRYSSDLSEIAERSKGLARLGCSDLSSGWSGTLLISGALVTKPACQPAVTLPKGLALPQFPWVQAERAPLSPDRDTVPGTRQLFWAEQMWVVAQ